MRIAFTLWLFLLCIGSSLLAQSFSIPEEERKRAPYWTARSCDQKPFSSELLKGKIFLLTFGYIGCQYCEYAYVEYEKVYAHFKDNPRVTFVYVNPINNIQQLKLYQLEKRMPGLVLSAHKETAENWGVTGYPSLFLVDQDGKICYRKRGCGPEDQFSGELIHRIEELLKTENDRRNRKNVSIDLPAGNG